MDFAFLANRPFWNLPFGRSEVRISLYERLLALCLLQFLLSSLNLALILKPEEILLVGLARDNLFNGVIDFFQAASQSIILSSWSKSIHLRFSSKFRSLLFSCLLLKRWVMSTFDPIPHAHNRLTGHPPFRTLYVPGCSGRRRVLRGK
jgi:hypothetical protein